MKKVEFHPKALATLRDFPEEVRRELGQAIFELQKGNHLSMPLAKPMTSIEKGVEELRVKDLRSYTMKKIKPVIAKNAKELAVALGLDEVVGLELEIRSDLNDKIIETVIKQELTHAQVAKLAKTSRTRVTALMNRQSKEISTDLMLRILGAIGVHAKIHFKKIAA